MIASSLFSQIVTPLPAAKPSDFTTIGSLKFLRASWAFSISFISAYLAAGILNLVHKFFIKIFEPSNCDAFLLGPNTLMFLFSKKSVIP